MRVCFVSRGTLRAFKETGKSEGADIIIFGFNGMGEVSYEKELKGESGFFEDVAVLSKRDKNIVVCGCVTDTRGHKRKSVAVAECGRLCGVSDMLYVMDGEVGSGAALRVYETKAGKMGVLVAEDMNFPELIKALAVCGSDFIVCPYGAVTDSMQQVLLRAHAYIYGIPIFFCAKGYCAVADGAGNIAFSSPHSPVLWDFENKREYHLIETRRRGFFKSSV